MRKIVLFCAAGMSTSLLVNKMKAAAADQGYEVDIAAYPISDIPTKGPEADIVLLGPQVRFKLAETQKTLSCPVEAIDMRAYGMMDGAKVIARVKEVLGD